MQFLITANLNKVIKIKKNIKNFDDILLLGEWCLYEDNLDIEDQKFNVYPFIWNNVQDTIKAQKDCLRIYEKCLTVITKEYNEYFGLKKNKDFYRIIMGYWLIHFIHQAYDKFTLLSKASKDFDLNTIILDDKDHIIPYDFNEFISMSAQPLFQLQLYSQIIKNMEIKTKTISIANNINSKKKSNINAKYLIREFIHKFLYHLQYLITFFKKKITIISNPYFKSNSFFNYIKIIYFSKASVLFDFGLKNKTFHKKNLIFAVRDKFKTKNNKKFEELIISLVFKSIPKTYLENFMDNLKYSKKFYKNISRKKYNFLTYQSLYTNHTYQYFVANNRDKINIFSAQHGCGYGMDTFHVSEKFERIFVDKFYTYGWSDGNQTIPMPMPKILDEKSYNQNNCKILIASHVAPLYVLRLINFPMSTANLIDHVKFPLKFLRHSKFVDNIEIRYPETDYKGWNNFNFIKKEFPNIKIDKDKSFYNSLKNSKIFVSDHLGTSFLEALQFNIPSIIFINKDNYSFRGEFNFYFNKLLKNKIIFYDPEEASKFLNENYNNISDWWLKKEIQSLRLEVCKKYALTSDIWHYEWGKALKPE